MNNSNYIKNVECKPVNWDRIHVRWRRGEEARFFHLWHSSYQSTLRDKRVKKSNSRRRRSTCDEWIFQERFGRTHHKLMGLHDISPIRECECVVFSHHNSCCVWCHSFQLLVILAFLSSFISLPFIPNRNHHDTCYMLLTGRTTFRSVPTLDILWKFVSFSLPLLLSSKMIPLLKDIIIMNGNLLEFLTTSTQPLNPLSIFHVLTSHLPLCSVLLVIGAEWSLVIPLFYHDFIILDSDLTHLRTLCWLSWRNWFHFLLPLN